MWGRGAMLARTVKVHRWSWFEGKDGTSRWEWGDFPAHGSGQLLLRSNSERYSGRVTDGGTRLGIDFCGEAVAIDHVPFTIGRSADFVIDENPYLHRHFLQLYFADDGVPMLANTGSQLVATVSDPDGKMEAMLSPGATMPIVFSDTLVRFAAGSTQYEFTIEREITAAVPELAEAGDDGTATMGRIDLTLDQKLLVLSLAESALRDGSGSSAVIPTTAEAARRLGWKTTKYNRKLDNVCDKLATLGIRGLHGDAGSHAANRKGRLVEFALSSRLVTRDELVLLDQPHD